VSVVHWDAALTGTQITGNLEFSNYRRIILCCNLDAWLSESVYANLRTQDSSYWNLFKDQQVLGPDVLTRDKEKVTCLGCLTRLATRGA
jgi:hypothetical protein